jgi:glycosyltransferase involved in cell wall biosynthesis
LLGLGHEVEVIAPERFKNVPCPTYPEIRLAMCTPGRVGALIAEYAPDAVHIVTEGPLGWCARWWLKRRGIPFTTSFHTMFPKYLNVRFGLPESWSFAGLRRFHSAATATMYSTPRLRDLLLSQGFENLLGWVRGVDTDLFAPGEPEPLEFPRPIQMYVGRLAIEKGIEDFLRTDARGTKVVVGDGPQRAELERRYPAARFLGPRYDDELVRHYRAADVFVFPSRTDTLGLVQLEAMACGVPVAAYPVQGPLDVIGDSAAGAMNEELTLAIEQALKLDPEVCRARALEHSWDQSVVEFHANLVSIPALAFHSSKAPVNSEGETA